MVYNSRMLSRFNTHSIRFRVTLWVGACLVVLGAGLIGYTGYVTRRDAVEKARLHMQEVTQSEAQSIRLKFETAMSASRTMAQTLTAFKSGGGALSRAQVNAMLRQVLADNPDFLGTAVVWEPDAFDGSDRSYRFAPGHDATGRFIPYWSRGPDGKISLDPCLDYEVPGIGDYYLIPKRTLRETVLEPYVYPVQGENVYMTSMVVPVIVGGRFLGIADVDYGLKFLQQFADGVNLYGHSARLFLLTPGGMIASATGHPDFIGRHISSVPNLSLSVAEGESGMIGLFDGNLYASSPIVVGKAPEHWHAVLQVPERFVVAEANRRLCMMIAGAVLFSAIGIAAVILLLRRILLRRFLQLSASAARFASGKFDTRCEMTGDDEISLLGDSFNAMASRVETLVLKLTRSELLLTSIIDSTNDLIWTVDPREFRLLAFNSGLREYFSAHAHIEVREGYTLEDLFPSEEVSRIWYEFYRRALIEGKFTVEYSTVYSDRLLSLSFHCMKNEGEVFAISTFGRDITAQRKAEAALAASETKYRLIVENAPIGIFKRKFDGLYEYANPVMLRQLGCASLDDLNMVYGDASRRWSDPEKFELFCSELREHGQVTAFETDLLRADGVHKYFSLFVFLDRSTGMLDGFAADITEQKQAFEEHDRLVEQLGHSQRMDAIGQLAGGVAHDFNNILGGIIGAAELLADPSLSQNKRDSYISMITTAAGRASELTGKLLAFSRKGHRSSTAVDVAKIVDETVDILRRTIDKRIVIAYENPGVPSAVIGDDGLLQSVFMNIGINASHAMPDGGTLTFRLSSEQLDESCCAASPYRIEPGRYLGIEIRDTGCGMTPEVQSRIFEPFFTTKEKGKGTGLGLAAAYGTVRDHGGVISVSSEVGKGTSFYIRLPLTDQAPEAPSAENAPVTGSGTVLLVDDDEIIRLTAVRMLESLGYTVLSACDGREGVALFEREHARIDLVILDMIMPVMGGRDAYMGIRRIDPSATVIISSGFSKEDDLAEMKKLGLVGLIRKPFRKTELSRMVAEALAAGKR